MSLFNALAFLVLAFALVFPVCGAEEPGGDRLIQIESRLERIEALLEKLAEAKGSGTPASKTGDKELDAAIERVEKRYGIGGVAALLLGQSHAQEGRNNQVVLVHLQLLNLIYEGGEKAKVDPDLIKVLTALLKMRATDFSSAYSSTAMYGGVANFLTDPTATARGYGYGIAATASGEQARMLAPVLAECLSIPALERHAAAEAHCFPSAIVLPALQKAYDSVSANETARRQRLLAALAACGDAKALADIKTAIDKCTDDPKSLQLLVRYAQAGKPFGLYAMAKLAEEEIRKENRSVAGRAHMVLGGSGQGYQLMQLCGKSEDYSTAYQQAAANLTDEERKDTKKIQEMYREIMQRTISASVKWVYDKYDKLAWDADGRVFMATK